MQGLESICSAMWFIQPLLVGLLIFCSIRHLSLEFFGWKREVVVTVLVMAIYIFGLTIIRSKVTIEYYTDIAMVVLPIIYIGFLTDKIWNYISLKWYFGLLSVLIMISIY